MAVPTTIADLSTTAALNSPAGSDNLSTADDYLRAIQGIVKTVYTDSSARSETLTNKTVALGSNTVSGTFAQLNTAITDADLARTDAANTFTGVQTLSSQPILSALTASSAVATDASKGLVSVTNTGTGNNVLSASPTLTGTATVEAVTASGLISGATNYTGFKNRVINGNMAIDQRNAGASVNSNNAYTLDRFQALTSGGSAYSIQQNAGSVTPPIGFTKYLGITSLGAYSLVAGSFFFIRQFIEGYNIADLAWGTADAKTVTLSFQVRSSLTGTFGGSLVNGGGTRSYPFNYSIPVANTWTQISVTIAGDTTGTWATDNTSGMQVNFGLGVGSTNSGTAGSWSSTGYFSATGATSVVGTSGATFYITGVQLEKGSVATSFDYRPYGTELALCQRYYYRMTPSTTFQMFASGFVESTTSALGLIFFPTSLRISPTAIEQSGTASNYTVRGGGASAIACTSVPTFSSASPYSAATSFTVASGLTVGQSIMIRNETTSAYLAWSAEL